MGIMIIILKTFFSKIVFKTKNPIVSTKPKIFKVKENWFE